MTTFILEQPASLQPYKQLTIQELFERLNSCVRKGELALIEGAKLMAELNRRGKTHPYMKGGIFRWFKEIDAGTLDASAVIKFAGQDQILSRLVRVPLKTQADIAKTGTVKTVETRKGEIIETEKSLWAMPIDQLDRAFGERGIRTVAQQTKMLKAAEAPKPLKAQQPLVSISDDLLFIAGRAIEPSALIEPLRKLGYILTRKAG